MQKVTRIGPLSLGKLMGGVAAVFGLIFGVCLTLLSVFGATIATFEGGGAESLFGLLFGVGSLVALPLLYGAFGFVQGALTAVIANLAMRLFGGLELTIEG